MAMTGMRVITTELGLVEQTPPQALARQRARGVRALLRRAPRKQRRGLIEACGVPKLDRVLVAGFSGSPSP
jgi:hypothetical protein